MQESVSRSGLELSMIDMVRAQYGWNELPEKRRSLLLLFLAQFRNILVVILVLALVLSIALRALEGAHGWESFVDAGAILAILILNAVLGFLQEYKAEEAIAALRTLTAPLTRVRRGGTEQMIPSRELLPGDIAILESGDKIAADGELVHCAHLEVNESSLTGESQPIAKSMTVKPGTSLAEQWNRVFAGTSVTRGSAEIVVTGIGLQTEIGKVAQLVSETELPETPLARRMQRLSRMIGLIVLVLCVMVATIGFLRAMPPIAIVLLTVSMAVSAVPEGLPAVVTASLAMGVRRMASSKALVRRLDALETLGSVTVICSDKTGTITENRMKVQEVWLPTEKNDERVLLLRIAASCNHAVLPDLGDPTEIGLLQYAQEKGVLPLPIEEEEVPFTSEEKYMQTRHGELSYLKGAPEKILELSTGSDDKAVMRHATEMALKGLRVLGCAIAKPGHKPRFVGLIALEDPARDGVKQAIAEAKAAGIRTIMITGDGADTAAAIAGQVGIVGDVIEGRELDAMSDTELRLALETVSVFARVSPLHKIRILETLKWGGDVVAMTGDGVNDAPALKGAHVGIAMGKVGTQVAKEAASIVLADDSFATIVAAIREGRRIYDNIRKFVLYLLRANFGELTFITFCLFTGLPVPYLPIHILWINLMTDGLPALALAAEPADPNVMQRPPRPVRESLFSGEWGRFALYIMTAFAVPASIFIVQLHLGADEETARSMTFTSVIVFELLIAFTTRSPLPLWDVGFWGNRWLIGAVAVPLLLQFVLLYTPASTLFHLTALSLHQWIVILTTAFAGFFLLELLKPLHFLHRHASVLRTK